MNTETLASAIVGHLVGDYLLQNDWMALNKKKVSFPCVIHCLLWTAAVCLFSGWYSWCVITALFITHFIQDRTNIIIWWMKIIGQSRFMKADELQLVINTPRESIVPILSGAVLKPGLGPWSIIVVDNVFHILTIWIVWRFVAR